MTAPRFARWPAWRRWFGLRSERAAAAFLRRAGLRVVARNVVVTGGELDLIAVERTPDGPVIVVVEVRSTETEDLDRVAASVDVRKQRTLTEAALRFLAARRLLGHAVRFDVLAISWPPGRGEPRIVHHRHAFEAVGRFQMWN